MVVATHPPPHRPSGQATASALSIEELVVRDRPRERLRSLGAQALTTQELLALLLGVGGRSGSALVCAQRLLARADGSLGRLSALPLGALEAVDGVGTARAVAVKAGLELGRRMTLELRGVGVPVRSPRDVVAAFAPRLQELPVEEFHVVILDTQCRMERDVLVTRGLLNASLVHPREVFREAVADRAASVVLVHNHPSGDPKPSPDDFAITEQLVAAGRVLDIPVHDHVIIGRGCYVSFAEAGLL